MSECLQFIFFTIERQATQKKIGGSTAKNYLKRLIVNLASDLRDNAVDNLELNFFGTIRAVVFVLDAVAVMVNFIRHAEGRIQNCCRLPDPNAAGSDDRITACRNLFNDAALDFDSEILISPVVTVSVNGLSESVNQISLAHAR